MSQSLLSYLRIDTVSLSAPTDRREMGMSLLEDYNLDTGEELPINRLPQLTNETS